VTQPSAFSTCYGGQVCNISWVDDGQAPSLSSIGITRVDLYANQLQLVQSIQLVNASDMNSLIFT
ncbi:hypothetical protein M378DRAFT_40025, partial [Amanita muscaria Koide BX008]